jgi:hypothetical protein
VAEVRLGPRECRRQRRLVGDVGDERQRRRMEGYQR